VNAKWYAGGTSSHSLILNTRSLIPKVTKIGKQYYKVELVPKPGGTEIIPVLFVCTRAYSLFPPLLHHHCFPKLFRQIVLLNTFSSQVLTLSIEKKNLACSVLSFL